MMATKQSTQPIQDNSDVGQHKTRLIAEHRNIWKELDKIREQLSQLIQLNDKALIDSDVVNIWKELDGIHKQLTQLNIQGISVTSLPSLVALSSPTARNTDLCIPDLSNVLEALKNSGFSEVSWMDLGLTMGLYITTLKKIESDYKESSRCLMETLLIWLNRADNVMSKGRPSWDTLADALRRINKNTSAEYITEQKMRLETSSASNDAVRDGAIINVVKDASQSLVDQNMTKIDELLEKMESITSKPQEDINHQLIEMRKEIKQLNEINEQLKLHLDELSQFEYNLQEKDLAKKQASQYRSLYETVEIQLQRKNKEIEELNDKQKKAAIVLGKLKSSNKDITHQLETKTKQLEEIYMITKSELDELKQKELEQTSVEIKQEMEGKILSLSHQLREREEEVKQLSTDIKGLQFKNKSLKEMSDKFVSFVYSSLVKKGPRSKRYDTGRKRRVKWDKSGSGSVTLRSPTPSNCITLIRKLSFDRRPCERIILYSSSTESTIILLSQLHQTNVKGLEIFDTEVTVEILHIKCHLININQLEFLHLINTSLSTSGGLHLLTDAISTNTSLGELELWHDRLTEDDMVNISQILTINTTLQRLVLVNCNITDDGLVQLSNGLKHNKTLEVLDISNNKLITSTTVVCDIIQISSLTHLYLDNTSLPSDSIPQLLDALSTNNTIQLGIDEQHTERCKQHENYQHIQDRLIFW